MVRARATPNPTSNRTDRAVPNVQAPAENYGERQAQQASQRAVPVAAPPQGGPTPSPTPGGAPPTPAPTGPTGGAPTPGLPPVSGPGILSIPSTRPIDRTSRSPRACRQAPVPVPEALTGVGAVAANQAVEQGTLKNLLATLANGPASSSSIRDLAASAGT